MRNVINLNKSKRENDVIIDNYTNKLNNYLNEVVDFLIVMYSKDPFNTNFKNKYKISVKPRIKHEQIPKTITKDWYNITRPTKTTYYLNIAREVSRRSTCLKRNYGCVIVKNDEIIATGYNGSARGEPNCCDIHTTCPRADIAHNSGNYATCPAVHAEQNAMLSAPREKMLGATMYLAGFEHHDDGTEEPIKDCSPCPICSRLIKNAGISFVIVKSE